MSHYPVKCPPLLLCLMSSIRKRPFPPSFYYHHFNHPVNNRIKVCSVFVSPSQCVLLRIVASVDVSFGLRFVVVVCRKRH